MTVKQGVSRRLFVSPPIGDFFEQKFIGELMDIFGDTRFLWVPKATDTTTNTDRSRYAAVVTYSKDVSTFDDSPTRLGAGIQVIFDGDDEEADTPDAAGLSFGDGLVDKPFSVVWLGNRSADTSVQSLLSKLNSASVDEWELSITATNGYPTFDLIDASASGIIGRSHDTDIGTSDVLIVATYDGTRAVTGINIYKNGALVDDGTGGTTGTYTAMEDTASLVRIGMRYSTPARFYNGKMALAAVVGKELSIDEVWTIKELINSYYGLSL